MDRVFIRSTAFSFAFACGAMVVGPGVVGIADSHAILGIGPDLFDLFEDDDKSAMHHPRPGSEEFSAQAARTVGIETADAGPPVSTFGSVPESVSRVGVGGSVPEVPAAGEAAARCRAALSLGGHRICRPCRRLRSPATSLFAGHLPPRVRQPRPFRSPCRPRCDREPAASRWPCRPRAHRCQKVGLRLQGRRAFAAPRTKNPLAPNNSGGEQIRTRSVSGMRST